MLAAHLALTMQATFSRCGQFRYLLWERWDATKPMLAWCLMNPSRAGRLDGNGSHLTDHTWTKGRGFSERLGYGGQVFCNLYAYAATDPTDLKAAGYPVGRYNNQYILEAARMGDLQMVCAWGGLAQGLVRPAEVIHMLGRGVRLKALGFTKTGLPRHPLMLSYRTPLVDFHP